MTTFTVKTISSLASGGVVLGAAQVIDQQTLMPLGLIVSGITATAWMTWRAAKLLSGITSRLDRLEYRLSQLDRRGRARPPEAREDPPQ